MAAPAAPERGRCRIPPLSGLPTFLPWTQDLSYVYQTVLTKRGGGLASDFGRVRGIGPPGRCATVQIHFVPDGAKTRSGLTKPSCKSRTGRRQSRRTLPEPGKAEWSSEDNPDPVRLRRRAILLPASRTQPTASWRSRSVRLSVLPSLEANLEPRQYTISKTSLQELQMAMQYPTLIFACV